MSRSAETEQYINKCLGPRRVGGRYRMGYWGDEVTVLAVDRDPASYMLWSVTEANDTELAAGRSRTHCTPWDYDRDSVVAQPEAMR